jgi:hypothetical protein
MLAPRQATTAPAPPGAPLGGDPAAIYRALRDQGSILRGQQENLTDQRQDLQQQYDQMSSSNPGRSGLEARMKAIDARLADLDVQIAKSDAAVATASGVPGALYDPPEPNRDLPDPDMVAGLTFVVILVFAIPMSIAFARRIWRRSAKTEVVLPQQLTDRMESLERGMEAVALEVERIGEGQRFVTQALAERLDVRALGAGAAQPVGVKAGERVEQRR